MRRRRSRRPRAARRRGGRPGARGRGGGRTARHGVRASGKQRRGSGPPGTRPAGGERRGVSAARSGAAERDAAVSALDAITDLVREGRPAFDASAYRRHALAFHWVNVGSQLEQYVRVFNDDVPIAEMTPQSSCGIGWPTSRSPTSTQTSCGTPASRIRRSCGRSSSPSASRCSAPAARPCDVAGPLTHLEAGTRGVDRSENSIRPADPRAPSHRPHRAHLRPGRATNPTRSDTRAHGGRGAAAAVVSRGSPW